MSIAASTAQLPADAIEDLEYARASFRPMDDAVRPHVERKVLPQATYVLPDGTPMVPADHAALLDDAGGDPNAVASEFRDRFVAAGGDPAAAEEEHAAWLTGEYGACLHTTTPEAIVAKSALMTAITALLASPAKTDDGWRVALRAAVDALDAIERPFAATTATGSAVHHRGIASSQRRVSASQTFGRRSAAGHGRVVEDQQSSP